MAMLNNQRVIGFNHRPEISTLMSKSLDWFSREWENTHENEKIPMVSHHGNPNLGVFPSWESLFNLFNRKAPLNRHGKIPMVS